MRLCARGRPSRAPGQNCIVVGRIVGIATLTLEIELVAPQASLYLRRAFGALQRLWRPESKRTRPGVRDRAPRVAASHPVWTGPDHLFRPKVQVPTQTPVSSDA